MGQWNAFRCAACAYSAEVSGGPDCGRRVRTVTISCATCRKLYDVSVSDEPLKEPPDPVPDNPMCPSGRTQTHRTELWRHPGPCPRCGETMIDEGASTDWD